MPRPGRFTTGKETRCPLYRRLGGPQGRVCTGAENLAPTGIWSPDCPAHGESPFRLSYRGLPYINNIHLIFPLNGIINLSLHVSLYAQCLTKMLQIITFNLYKDLSLWPSWARLNYVEVWLHSFLTSALDGGKWSGSRPGCFTHVGRLLISDKLKRMLCGSKEMYWFSWRNWGKASNISVGVDGLRTEVRTVDLKKRKQKGYPFDREVQ